MKISEVLKKAKPVIKQYEYVCHAVLSLNIPKKDKIKTTSYIESLLRPNITANFWLFTQGIPPKQLTNKNMLSYRHRWVDHMIRELEKKGK